MDTLNTRKPKCIIDNIISIQERHQYSEVPGTTVECVFIKLLTIIKYGPGLKKMYHSQDHITWN